MSASLEPSNGDSWRHFRRQAALSLSPEQTVEILTHPMTPESAAVLQGINSAQAPLWLTSLTFEFIDHLEVNMAGASTDRKWVRPHHVAVGCVLLEYAVLSPERVVYEQADAAGLLLLGATLGLGKDRSFGVHEPRASRARDLSSHSLGGAPSMTDLPGALGSLAERAVGDDVALRLAQDVASVFVGEDGSGARARGVVATIREGLTKCGLETTQVGNTFWSWIAEDLARVGS